MASEKTFKRGLYLFMFIGLAGSVFLIMFQTNLFYVQDGSIARKSIDVSSVLDGETGAGYIQLDRNSATPSFLELVTFDNGKQFDYFTIDEGERFKKELVLDIPEGLESGEYFVDYNIVINGKSFTETYSVRVV